MLAVSSALVAVVIGWPTHAEMTLDQARVNTRPLRHKLLTLGLCVEAGGAALGTGTFSQQSNSTSGTIH